MKKFGWFLIVGAISGCSGSTEDSPTPAESPTSPAESPTAAPVTPTEAPATPTEAPATPTAAPVTPTEVPPTPTQEPTPPPTPVPWKPELLTEGLSSPWFYEYLGNGDGGVGHLTYWKMSKTGEAYLALPVEEQAKVNKIQTTNLVTSGVAPTVQVPGYEATGTLTVIEGGASRTQEVLLKLPVEWNGRLVVLPSPGVHTEFGNELGYSWWLTEAGYAVASTNKGVTNAGASSAATLQNGQHPTAQWGAMTLDLTRWAQARLAAVTGETPRFTYLAGQSNGGYVVRRALELDHQRVQTGETPLFDGALDHEGGYWPDARVMDTDVNGQVSVSEFLAAPNLVNDTCEASLVMGWIYAENTACKPENYTTETRYAGAQAGMVGAGFLPESAIGWCAYNNTFDYLKAFGTSYAYWKGVGYYNYSCWLYTAELMGHDSTASAAYTPFSFDGNIPPLYAYMSSTPDRGITADTVAEALRLANTGEFSAPLISIQGELDTLLGTHGHGYAYQDAVAKYGNSALHRFYVVAGGFHVDLHADGAALDFNNDGTMGNEGAAAELTPLQGYVQRAFEYLVAWTEEGQAAPASKTITTNPASDVLDPTQLSFE